MPANFTIKVNCPVQPVAEITGTIETILTGVDDSGGLVRMNIVFDQALPHAISFDWGFDFTSTSSYLNTSNGYPAPKTYSNGNSSCGGNRASITSGSSTYEIFSKCAEPGAPYGYVSKIVIFNKILPNGYVLSLRPVRQNMSLEIR